MVDGVGHAHDAVVHVHIPVVPQLLLPLKVVDLAHLWRHTHAAKHEHNELATAHTKSVCVTTLLLTWSACITIQLFAQFAPSQHSYLQSACNYTLASVFEFILHDALGGLGGRVCVCVCVGGGGVGGYRHQNKPQKAHTCIESLPVSTCMHHVM